MIVAAGLLVLVGLGLFVAGVLTGDTPFYWACVGACVVAAVLLVVARLRMRSGPAGGAATDGAAAAGGATTTATGPTATTTGPAGAGGATAVSVAATKPADAAAAPSVPVEAAPAASRPGTASSPSAGGAEATPSADGSEPPVEEVEVTDLLLVVDLKDEVLVVDEHPRYHVSGCRYLAGKETIPIPLDEARTDGFTPCGVCCPDATLADRERARK